MLPVGDTTCMVGLWYVRSADGITGSDSSTCDKTNEQCICESRTFLSFFLSDEIRSSRGESVHHERGLIGSDRVLLRGLYRSCFFCSHNLDVFSLGASSCFSFWRLELRKNALWEVALIESEERKSTFEFRILYDTSVDECF